MDMPRPVTNEHHAWLARLAGRWEGAETISPSPMMPDGGQSFGRVVNRLALDDFVLVQDYVQEQDGAVHVQGHAVFSYDATRDIFLLDWWDASGMPPGRFSGRREGDRLTVEADGPMGKVRATYELGGDSYSFAMEVSPDGSTWHGFLSGTYTRQD